MLTLHLPRGSVQLSDAAFPASVLSPAPHAALQVDGPAVLSHVLLPALVAHLPHLLGLSVHISLLNPSL